MILNKKTTYCESYTAQYFGLNVRVYTTENSLYYYSAFPWMYEIEFNGKLIHFTGIPNYLETKRKALKKAWYRAKWLSENTFNEKYK